MAGLTGDHLSKLPLINKIKAAEKLLYLPIKINEQKAMADDLIDFIEGKKLWD